MLKTNQISLQVPPNVTAGGLPKKPMKARQMIHVCAFGAAALPRARSTIPSKLNTYTGLLQNQLCQHSRKHFAVGRGLTVQTSHSTAPQSASRDRRRPYIVSSPTARLVRLRSRGDCKMPWLGERLRCRKMRRRWTMPLARREKKRSEAVRSHKVRQAHDESVCPLAGVGPIQRVA